MLPVFSGENTYQPDLNWLNSNDTILIVTGIANPVPMVKWLKQYKAKVKVIHFSDHHDFSREDLNFITKTYNRLEGDRKFIITTEKDAVRFINNAYFPHELRKQMFYLPIEVEFLGGDDDFIASFFQTIDGMVRSATVELSDFFSFRFEITESVGDACFKNH